MTNSVAQIPSNLQAQPLPCANSPVQVHWPYMTHMPIAYHPQGAIMPSMPSPVIPFLHIPGAPVISSVQTETTQSQQLPVCATSQYFAMPAMHPAQPVNCIPTANNVNCVPTVNYSHPNNGVPSHCITDVTANGNAPCTVTTETVAQVKPMRRNKKKRPPGYYEQTAKELNPTQPAQHIDANQNVSQSKAVITSASEGEQEQDTASSHQTQERTNRHQEANAASDVTTAAVSHCSAIAEPPRLQSVAGDRGMTENDHDTQLAADTRVNVNQIRTQSDVPFQVDAQSSTPETDSHQMADQVKADEAAVKQTVRIDTGINHTDNIDTSTKPADSVNASAENAENINASSQNRDSSDANAKHKDSTEEGADTIESSPNTVTSSMIESGESVAPSTKDPESTNKAVTAVSGDSQAVIAKPSPAPQPKKLSSWAGLFASSKPAQDAVVVFARKFCEK